MKTGKRGDIVPVGDFVLAEARERRFIGTLLSEGRTPMHLHFREGLLINIESWDPVYSLPAFALATELITMEEYRRIRETQLATGERFVDLLRKVSRADRPAILRLYETFAFVTLLSLMRENGHCSLAEGPVLADPLFMEAVTPERFAERLKGLAQGKAASSASLVRHGRIVVNDTSCGLDEGPVLAGFVRSQKGFVEHWGAVENALKSGAAHLEADRPLLLSAAISFALFIILSALILLCAPRSGVDGETLRQPDILRLHLDDRAQALHDRAFGR